MSDLTPCHWAFDCREVRPRTLITYSLLASVLERLVRATGLRPWGQMQGWATVSGWRGWAARQMTVDGHIIIHGQGRECFVTIFSCREYPVDLIIKALEVDMKGTWEAKQLR